ncbi:hypothetical protein GSY71_07000 [Pusillimonas sp. TS35]|uniref:MOSC N-terminal beta barrel domain-containing protein n=1 Tax=Paracandidimonas lactea TaxID=2895524 RepID=UPI00136E0C73|nr:MOSC N-terminal beta barrel domain-containing protein [Paracandidimonas lactea]MYN12891.1 hypothetical protein [Pusillimonas sp. TS35]
MTQYHPIAGCGGLPGSAAAACDRRWLIVDQDGQWIGPAQCDRLDGVQVELRFGYLVVRAPGMLRLDVPVDVIEDDDSVRTTAQVGGQHVDVVDEGALAAAWFSNCLERPCRLVKVHPDAPSPAWPAA